MDLSKSTLKALKVNPENHNDLNDYLDQNRIKEQAKVLYGGYLEKRSLYDEKSLFKDNIQQRNIHLGVDFWANAGEDIIAPLDGIVHSFKDNKGFGNYGPCIILEHNLDSHKLFTLYGHLSRKSLTGLKIGKVVKRNQVFCALGTADENGGYVPHLHFQIIKDIQDYKGDYPGVCSSENLEYFKMNTINPFEFLDL